MKSTYQIKETKNERSFFIYRRFSRGYRKSKERLAERKRKSRNTILDMDKRKGTEANRSTQ